MDSLDLQATVQSFLSAFVSETLAARGLYPPSAFAPARVLGASARRARHPGLCAYVDKAAAALTVRGREGREGGKRGPAPHSKTVWRPMAGEAPPLLPPTGRLPLRPRPLPSPRL